MYTHTTLWLPPTHRCTHPPPKPSYLISLSPSLPFSRILMCSLRALLSSVSHSIHLCAISNVRWPPSGEAKNNSALDSLSPPRQGFIQSLHMGEKRLGGGGGVEGSLPDDIPQAQRFIILPPPTIMRHYAGLLYVSLYHITLLIFPGFLFLTEILFRKLQCTLLTAGNPMTVLSPPLRF